MGNYISIFKKWCFTNKEDPKDDPNDEINEKKEDPKDDPNDDPKDDSNDEINEKKEDPKEDPNEGSNDEINEKKEDPKDDPNDENKQQEDDLECVICYITQKEIDQQNLKDIVFIPCERCKKTICIECMNEMSKTQVGYFCPMCRFGHPDDKSSNNNDNRDLRRPSIIEPVARLQIRRPRHNMIHHPDIPIFQQFLAAIRRNNYEEVCYYLDNELVNPADQNNRAFLLAMSVEDRRIIEKISSDRRVNILAFENQLRDAPFNYQEFLSSGLTMQSANNGLYREANNWNIEYDLGRPYF